MFHSQKKKPVPYTGDIVVCLDKARPFSEIPDGRSLIANFTKFKIKLQNGKVLGTLSENDIAVPVFMCNRDGIKRERDVDWTKDFSPIVEIDCEPLQRWWPRSMFRGIQKIGEEEIVTVEGYNKFTIQFVVTYAYTHDLKQMFQDIRFDEDEEEKSDLEAVNPKQKLLEDLREMTEVPQSQVDCEIHPAQTVLPRQKSNNTLKIIIGASAFVLLSIGLYFGIKSIRK
jgi:hypothetical protein